MLSPRCNGLYDSAVELMMPHEYCMTAWSISSRSVKSVAIPPAALVNDPFACKISTEAISSQAIASCKVASHILQFAGNIRCPSTLRLLACDLVVGASGSTHLDSSYPVTRYDRELKPLESVQKVEDC